MRIWNIPGSGIPVLRKQKKADVYEFESSLFYKS